MEVEAEVKENWLPEPRAGGMGEKGKGEYNIVMSLRDGPRLLELVG